MSGYHQGLLIGALFGFTLGMWIFQLIDMYIESRDERRRKNVHDMYERSKRDKHDD